MQMTEKKRIGIVVAIEVDSVLQKYGAPVESRTVYGCPVHIFETEKALLYVLDSGAGEINAATGTLALIAEFHVEMILNFGVVGALSAEMATAELCVVERVIHYDMDTTGWLDLPRGQYPGKTSPYVYADKALLEKAVSIHPALRKVTCASADKFVSAPEAKTHLREAYAADICEMEAAGILFTCARCGIPCLSVKAISDSLTGGGAEFFSELSRVSAICFDVFDKIVQAL